MKGKFITFEGGEGVGKSKQISMLKEYLDSHKIKYIMTREPGGTPISEKIREIILSKNNSEMTDYTEALLYASARAQLIDEVILPKLNEGYTVFCDRYIDSSFAYQAYARGLGYDFIKSVNSYAIEKAMPDYTVFLNLDPVSAFKRKGGADKTDRLELSGAEFHKKVYEGYLELLKKDESGRIINIDCRGTKDETHAKIINALKKAGVL